MKKTIALLIALILVLVQCGAVAEMGVQIIGGPETETEPVSLDDIKMNVDAAIDGYGTLSPTGFNYVDKLKVYKKGDDWSTTEYDSGADAEYAILYMDILNTTTNSKNYLSSCEVKAVYDDVYEYAGWSYQFNWNNGTQYGAISPKECPINTEDVFPVDPMYAGHYCFGCTLPNAVVENKAPLKLVIIIDGNEITYNIRK